jgi:nicotinamide-nucleotide amidase
METERSVIISLPGVPNEMEHILHESIIPYLQRRYDLNHVIKVRVLHCAGLGEGSIDEKIGDLETLANPTVGLAAHTGVVDVRIAAKAENESRAMELIAEVESAVRTRLGSAVFGADADRLESVALQALAGRGWTLVGIEAGLGGLLATRLPRTIAAPDLTGDGLMQASRDARLEAGTDVALGVAAFPEQRAAEMVLITPRTEKRHRITSGGPPRSLSRWAVNLALNWLRTTMQETT